MGEDLRTTVSEKLHPRRFAPDVPPAFIAILDCLLEHPWQDVAVMPRIERLVTDPDGVIRAARRGAPDVALCHGADLLADLDGVSASAGLSGLERAYLLARVPHGPGQEQHIARA